MTLSGTTLYGITSLEGTAGFGSVFSVGTNGTGFQSLVSFSGTGGAYPGVYPSGSLTLIGTNLYGTTQEGGSSGFGSLFKVGTNGTGFQNLLSFSGTGGTFPGISPGDLTAASSATVALGGAANATIISGGTSTLGATVTNSATSSTLYGMTGSGGTGGYGSAFSLTVSGANNLNYTMTQPSRVVVPRWGR